MHHVRMEQLKRTITESSDAYDALVQKREQLEETIQRQLDEQIEHKNRTVMAYDRFTKRAVCNAFGWSYKSVDPVILREACAFWDGCSNGAQDLSERISYKARLEIWLEITFRGFKGEALEVLEKAFKKVSKCDVVELARSSDVYLASLMLNLWMPLLSVKWGKKNMIEDYCVVMQHYDARKSGY
jgi:hypothetical protein